MASPDFDDRKVDSRPDMAVDSAEVVMLRDIANQLRLLNHHTVSAHGGNAGKIDWLKGPQTAMEIAEVRIKRRNHLSLAARLLPHKREQLEAQILAESQH